jgi:hypothetical protein
MSANVETVLLAENGVVEEPKKTKFYDDRTLSIKTDHLSPEQICTALQATMMAIRVRFGYPAYFHLAYVMAKVETKVGDRVESKVVPKGWCYLTVNRPEVYHLLLGRKPDGSENVDYIVDPEWVAPPESDEDREVEEEDDDLPPLPDFHASPSTPSGSEGTKMTWDSFPSFSMNWADIINEEVEKEQRRIEKEPPKIKVFLGKLIPDPRVLTKDGWYTIESVASRVKVDLSEEAFLKIDTNKVRGYFPNILSLKEIENYFRAFSPSSDRYPEMYENKNDKGAGRGPPSRSVVIKFKPQSHDALFVIQTNLRRVIRDKNGNRHITYISHPPAFDGK